jgi:ribulose-5-phosphate 4-epimerase/fuculose-1-phosphate aldolase
VTTLEDAQAQARIDLAACYRLCAHFGYNEGIDNHLTLMVPGFSDRFYLAPFGLHWSEVKASDMLSLDFEGMVRSGQGPVEATAKFIHMPVHRVTGAACVLHTHMPHATALTMLENPKLEMALQVALVFYDDISYEATYNGLAYDEGEGERLARFMGKKSVAFLQNHGVIVIGNSAAQAFERLYFLERAAQAQILALSTGRALKRLPDTIVAATAAQMKAGSQVAGKERHDLHFDALKRILDRLNGDYVR